MHKDYTDNQSKEIHQSQAKSSSLRRLRSLFVAVLLTLATTMATAFFVRFSPPASPAQQATLATAFRQLTKNTAWTQTDVIEVDFDTYHGQGFAKVGTYLFLSSVEVLEPTRRYDAPREGLDRTAGRGKGHLFKMDLSGRLLAQIELGGGAIYHPGGIDFDGTHLWVPVAEYRPDSRAIVYRVDPASMQAVEVFRFDDHLGGLVHNPDDGTLHGVSWGSRRFYTWQLDEALRLAEAGASSGPLRTLNPAHYIDYQDCQYVGAGEALCAGLNHYRQPTVGRAFALGGLELIDLRQGLPLHQIPVPLWTEQGLTLTRNPVELEATETGLRGYFMPEDNQSRLFIFDVSLRR